MLNRKFLVCMIGSGIFSLLPIYGRAAQLDYTLDLTAANSDNINQSSDDPISQNVLIPGIDFAFHQKGSTIQASAAGRVEYRDYLQGEFDNQVRGELSGLLNWVIAPERLAFSVADYASVQPVNTLERYVPTNLQQTNVLIAGPTLSFRVGNTMRGQAELLYMDSLASKNSEFDSERGMAALRVLKDLNQTDLISANLEVNDVNYRNNVTDVSGGGTDYDSYQLFGRYQSKLARFNIDAALGWSDFQFKDGFPSESGPLARANIDWQATSRSSFGGGFAHQFADATTELIVDPTKIGTVVTSIAPGNVQVTPHVFMLNRLEINYAFQGPRLSFQIAPFYRRAEYVTNPSQDETDHGASANINYLLNPYWKIGFAAGGQSTQYTTIDRHDDFLSYGPYVSQQLNLHWSWRAELTRNQRNSTAPGIAYDENLVFFAFSYKR